MSKLKKKKSLKYKSLCIEYKPEHEFFSRADKKKSYSGQTFWSNKLDI